jgi:SAM-dependent methyltransferase
VAPGRNDPCWCDSGRKYKQCHLRIDEASGIAKYAAAQAVYAVNWQATAERHYQARLYHWLAEQLQLFNVRRVLDIGCGSGHGLLGQLDTLGADVKIVAIDENRECLQVTKGTLVKANHTSVDVVTRMTISGTPDCFNHTAEPITEPITKQITLIEADVCNDPFLLEPLLSSGPFDAVTIWLTGVHMLRQNNAQVIARGIQSEGAHRLYVQNAVYELADNVLRKGSILQVADRGQNPDTELLREDVLRAHRDQASVTSLEVRDLFYQTYEQPATNRTPMVFTPGISGHVPHALQPAIISIISVKP